MKNFKSLIALAVMASLALNAVNAHAYIYTQNEVATGASADASGTISVKIMAASPTPATQIAVSFLIPQVLPDGTLDRSRVTMVDAPALSMFGHALVPTPLQGHNRWVFVVTNVDKGNQIKAFWVY